MIYDYYPESKIENPLADLLADKKVSHSTFESSAKRQKTDKVPKRQQSLQEKAIKHYNKPCCNNKCLWSFSLKQCLESHAFLARKTQAESRLWLKQKLECLQSPSTKNTNPLLIDGVPVCHAAFKQMYGISNNKFAACVKLGNQPNSIPVHGNVGNKNNSRFTAKQHTYNWIASFVEECGDQNPVDNTIHVPKYIAKTSLYSLYKDKWQADELPVSSIPSSSLFYTVLEDQFGHVKFLRKTVLGRCDFCMSIPQQKQKISNDAELDAFKEACKLHYELHSSERLLYGNRTQTSRAHPNRVLHMVIDCPDGYDLPHVAPATKDTVMLDKLSVNAVGCINHSSGLRDYMFYLGTYKKNPNLILTVLYLHLIKQFENGLHAPVLWLQLDNCFKENKNRWMLGFCCWLIKIGWFTEIMLSMLPPGHTHIDIDQMFSTLSIYFDTHSVLSLTELVKCLSKAYHKENTKPSGSFLPVVYNFIGFLAPFVKDISGISTPHVFLLRKLPDETIGMKVKKWHSTSSAWMGAADKPDDWIELMSGYPVGKPNIVLPSNNPDNIQQSTINKYNRWLSEPVKAEWSEFCAASTVPGELYWKISDNVWKYNQVYTKILYTT